MMLRNTKFMKNCTAGIIMYLIDAWTKLNA
jgi:hypothetical protein